MIKCDEFTKDYLNTLKVQEIKTNKKVTYLNIESGFDIETTSTTYQGNKVAFMYIWQFGLGVDNPIFYGRTWEEFLNLLEILQEHFNLNADRRLVIYVHNLGYEFQFMRKYFNWLNVFAIDERKPIKALCDMGIEFRDSYILSGYSLANTAKNLTKHKVKKLVGDLDYSLIRHHNTPLTEQELAYCENDIQIILAYIDEQIEQYGDINKIPLTNTGRVRSYVKHNCYYTNKNHAKSSKGKYDRYKNIMKDLTLTPESYSILKRSFMGGFTHSNPNYTGKTLENVGSIDLTSSYPSVMLADQFPMSRPKIVNVNSVNELMELAKTKCLVFDVKFVNIQNTLGYESYISENKCRGLKGAVLANGRVVSADELTMTITEIDFQIISKVYKWEKVGLQNVHAFSKGYLPKPIIESILDLYEKKTTLKGVEGEEVEYLLSKGMLNSVYGMCVTDVVKDNSVYNDTWEIEKVNIDDKITEYNSSNNRFLYYAWGIYVTAYARRNLWTGILSVGGDYVYSDTDSIKCLNFDSHSNYVERYNQTIQNKLELMCEHYNLDKTRLTPKTIEGVEKPLGVWEFEGNYDRFKTLGAKRYLVQEGDKYTLTVAGLSKKNGIEHIVDVCNGDSDLIFDMFNDNLYIPSDKTGKMTHTYIDDEMDIVITDYEGNTVHVNAKSGVHLEPCDFTLSISKQFNDFLEQLALGYIFKGGKYI